METNNPNKLVNRFLKYDLFLLSGTITKNKKKLYFLFLKIFCLNNCKLKIK